MSLCCQHGGHTLKFYVKVLFIDWQGPVNQDIPTWTWTGLVISSCKVQQNKKKIQFEPFLIKFSEFYVVPFVFLVDVGCGTLFTMLYLQTES